MEENIIENHEGENRRSRLFRRWGVGSTKREIGSEPSFASPSDYERPRDSPIFDMMVIIGLTFNVLVVVFMLLYWLDLL